MSEEQQMPEYKQGDNVRLTVELRDRHLMTPPAKSGHKADTDLAVVRTTPVS